MSQIVSAKINENGNHVIEVKPLGAERISKTGKTIQVAGTNGWAEPLPGVWLETSEGKKPLTAVIQIRRKYVQSV